MGLSATASLTELDKFCKFSPVGGTSSARRGVVGGGLLIWLAVGLALGPGLLFL